MPLSTEQKLELDLFEKELELQNPSDTLQFAANYFNKRLELQRGFVRDQAKLALSKGIILFPPTSKSDSTAASSAALKSQGRVTSLGVVHTPVPSTTTTSGSSSTAAAATTTTSSSSSNTTSNGNSSTPVATGTGTGGNNNNNIPTVSAVINESGPTQASGAIVFKSPFDNRSLDPNLGPEPEVGPDSIPTPVGGPDNTITSKATQKKPVSSDAETYDSAPSNFFKGGFSLSGDSEVLSPSGKRKSCEQQQQQPPSESATASLPPPLKETQKFPRTSSDNNNNSNKLSKRPKSYTPLPLRFNAERRTSVSGESINPDKFDDWTPEHYHEKTADQMKRLEKSIGKNFLFNNLDIDNKRLVINCLEEKKVPKNGVIINQGDEGDYFYIVESGVVEFYVNSERVSASGPGSSFGELALMYNSPRAATAVAQTDCVLWSLDRMTFRKVLLGSSFKKRIMYDDLLKSVPVLKTLTTYDRAKLSDALETRFFEPGQIIVREGEVGENFYLIEYGECEVSKEGEGVVNRLKGGDYFGEIALINDLPRQATVTAVKATKVAFLGKSGFQRLLGPVVDVLKLNDPRKIH